MKQIFLIIFILATFIPNTYASFPVIETVNVVESAKSATSIISEGDTGKFQLDIVAFIIGILTFWLIPLLVGLPLLLLFVRKKHFRGSLAWGWLTGLLLPLLIMFIIFEVPKLSFIY
jgi:hypothetical protein